MYSVLINENKFIGEKFGRIKILRPMSITKGRTRLYECLCDCGQTFYAPKHAILIGKIKSCKCLRLENTRQMGRSRKGIVYPKTKIKRIAKSKITRYGKTVNGRAYDSLILNGKLMADLFGFNTFAYVWTLTCKMSEYEIANHCLEKISKSRNKWIGKNRAIWLTMLDSTTFNFIVIALYPRCPSGREYISLKKAKTCWIHGDVQRITAFGKKAIEEAIECLSSSIDQSLDSCYDKKIRTFRGSSLIVEKITRKPMDNSPQDTVSDLFNVHSPLTKSNATSVKEQDHQETLAWLNSLPYTSDNWLDSCPETKASFERGLAQAKSGKVVRHSFVDLEFDD